jgi:hypothetical protein
MIDPKVITEILKANGITSRSAPVGNPHRPAVPGPEQIPANGITSRSAPVGNPHRPAVSGPEQIPAGSAGEALFG